MNPNYKRLVKHRLLKPWMQNLYSARARCYNENTTEYARYGGRGIKCLLLENEIATLWLRDRAYDMKRPSLDRINNDGNYEYSNCRFIEHVENNRLKAIRFKYPRTIVDQIREVYAIGGITQRQLAAAFGMSQFHVWEIVNSKSRTSV